MIRFFLDTTIILSSFILDRKEHLPCVSIILQNNIPLLTNEYILKEVRRILEETYSFNQEDINQFMEFLITKLEIVKTPSKEEFIVIKSRDKSDRPIIFSAKKHQCVLITDDFPTKKDAEKYILAFKSKEAMDIFDIKPAKG